MVSVSVVYCSTCPALPEARRAAVTEVERAQLEALCCDVAAAKRVAGWLLAEWEDVMRPLAAAWLRAQMRRAERPCATCGRLASLLAHQQYCSAPCRRRAQNARAVLRRSAGRAAALRHA